MSAELKPCPFCGLSKARVDSDGVMCGVCFAFGPTPHNSLDDDEITKLWNGRTESTFNQTRERCAKVLDEMAEKVKREAMPIRSFCEPCAWDHLVHAHGFAGARAQAALARWKKDPASMPGGEQA